MNIEDVPKDNFKGLNDIDEYDSDEIPDEYDSEYENISKVDFQTFKIPRKMEDYKWEVEKYFATKEDFKEGVRTYVIHFGRNLKFNKNDNQKMRLICKAGYPFEAYYAKISQ